ncbi:MAG: hypothetical protein AUH30_17815 [Candidatus Rokubacteria bacterium 13_1_40CM_68_15]|nr:MAG: hypothetical protein AUH30_17815 [Candidatus Rokubacteria bacterium 13_1_40CM_68_15]
MTASKSSRWLTVGDGRDTGSLDCDRAYATQRRRAPNRPARRQPGGDLHFRRPDGQLLPKIPSSSSCLLAPALDAFRSLHALRSLDTLRLLDSLHPFDSLHALRALDPLELLNPLDALRALHTLQLLDALDAIHPLSPLRSVGPLDTFGSLWPFGALSSLDAFLTERPRCGDEQGKRDPEG